MNKLNAQIKFLLILGILASTILYADTTPLLTQQQQLLAPGYGALEFAAPELGSYKLPVLGSASDGNVLDTQGKVLTIHSLMGEKVVLLSFIYSNCSEVNGWTLATAVLHKINNRLKKEPELAAQLRLVTLSFNPQHDTPEMM